MRTHPFFIVFFFVTFFTQINGQHNIIWEKTWGGKQDDVINKVVQMSNGVGLAVGFTHVLPNKNQQGLVIFFSADNGTTQKELHFGGIGVESFNDVVQLRDGTLLLVGYSSSRNSSKDAWLLHIDETGLILQEKYWGETGEDEFKQVFSIAEGYVATGHIYQQGVLQAMLLFLNENFQTKQERYFTSQEIGHLKASATKPDGGILLLGNGSISKNSSSYGILVSSTGELIWKKQLSNSAWEEISSVYFDVDRREFVVTGSKWASQSQKEDLQLRKIDTLGQVTFDTLWGGNDLDMAHHLCRLEPSGFLVNGETKSHRPGARATNALVDLFELPRRIDSNNYGEDKNEFANGAIQLFDGDLLVAGVTESIGEGQKDAWAFRLSYKANEASNFLSAKGTEPLKCSEPRLEGDNNKNGILEPQERGYISLSVSNISEGDIPDLKVKIIAENSQVGVKILWQVVYLGYLGKGKQKKVDIPVLGEINLVDGNSRFRLQFESNQKVLHTKYANLRSATSAPESSKPLIYWDNIGQPSANQRGIRTSSSQVSLRASVVSSSKLKPAQFQVYHNGTLLENAKNITQNLVQRDILNDKSIYYFSLQVNLDVPDKHQIRIDVVDEYGNISSTPVLIVDYQPAKPNLHILAIGPKYEDLHYTGKDAFEFASAFKGQEGKLFNNIHVTILNDSSQTTQRKIIESFLDMKNSFEHPSEAVNALQENDVVLVFISGHGLIEKNTFYIVPSDYDPKYGDRFLINYELDILAPLTALKCKKMLFIDACHSGAAKNGAKDFTTPWELSIALNELNNQTEGMMIFTSCSPKEISFEHVNWENGAYTEALLELLKPTLSAKSKAADIDQNGILTINETIQYVTNRVPELIRTISVAGASQRPNSINDFKHDISFYVFE